MTQTHLALTYDLFILYKRVSRVGFAGHVKFCHPYTKLTYQFTGNDKRQAFKEIYSAITMELKKKMILLTYALMTYIRKPFKETFFIKKNEKVINFVIIFSNPHKTVLKNKWLMHAFLRIYL